MRPRFAWQSGWPRLAPGNEPKRVFFTNSGAEAIEAALKLARRHTGRNRALAFMDALHGRTYGAMSLSGSKPMQRRGFSPLVPDIHHVRYGDLDSVQAVLRTICPADELAAIFVEPIQGEGGYIVPPAEFLPGLRRLCDDHGVLLVLDEVQSGMGPHGQDVCFRALGRGRRYRVPGQGNRQWPAPGGDRGTGFRHGLAQRQPRLDIRRQPGGLCGALATVELLTRRYIANARGPRGPAQLRASRVSRGDFRSSARCGGSV